MANRSRRSSGGGRGGGTTDKVVWFFVVAGLIFAFFQIPYDPGAKGIIEILQSKTESVKQWATGIAPSVSDKVKDVIEGGDSPSNPSPGEGIDKYEEGGKGSSGVDKGTADTNLSAIRIANPDKISYDRDEWNHWIDVRSCWTVREQVLARDAVELELVDKQGNPTTDINSACEIKGGKWVDFYSGKEITNPRSLDIDHMIPLSYTAQHGGQGWDKQKKQDYANNLEGTHLIAVSAGENRSKSDQGPSEWKPSDTGYYCEYAKSWTTVASKWQLSITEADAAALREMLATC
jgi:hypothetical protein